MLVFPKDLRRAILYGFHSHGFRLNGSQSLFDFLNASMDLKKLPSFDSRLEDAQADLYTHTVMFLDWSDDDVWNDSRFNPTTVSDEDFKSMLFLALSLRCQSLNALRQIEKALAPIFSAGGFRLEPIENYTVFEGYRVVPAAVSVNNQGRAHSQNPAPIEHMGLYFRSPAEIQLCRALMNEGYLMAPLPVFIQIVDGKFRRCEPDFIVVRFGIWAVVEVDGAQWHRETPVQAHDRLLGFTDQSVRLIRVPATIASGSDWAQKTVAFINQRFEQWNLSRG